MAAGKPWSKAVLTMVIVTITAPNIFVVYSMGLCEFEEMFDCLNTTKKCHLDWYEEVQTEGFTKMYSTEELAYTQLICPDNMIFTNCSCQGTCRDPQGCHLSCIGAGACICRKGFLMHDGNCVPQSNCSCYIEDVGVISDGATYIDSKCSMKCACVNDELQCDNDYSCSADGQCIEANQSHQCVCQDGFLGNGRTCTRPIDCSEWFEAGYGVDGIYKILPSGWPGLPFDVFCDMSGGGWTVFQRRVDGSIDFYLNWESYKRGFGDMETEFWLGNEKLFYLTNQDNYQLRIDLMNSFGNVYFANFDLFRINDENDNYRLSQVGTFHGDADTTNTGYALSYHRGQSFSTYDRDNDRDSFSCAQIKKGAWWYKSCYASNLNGVYTTASDEECINWYNLPESNTHVKYVQMELFRIKN